MKTDLEIAQAANPAPIQTIAERLGLKKEDLVLYGDNKAKVKFEHFKDREQKGKLILVTAMTPTKAGEGKSTTSVGLADALSHLGKKAIVCLREPSMGPVFGLKGGAAGGGYAQVIPMDEINLHFTGDLHAIGAANNLIAACIDNHLYWGNDLDIDLDRITWRRAVDMNDRALRKVEVMRGSRKNRYVHDSGFDITVASEVMAVFCLAQDRADLKRRLAEMVVAYNTSGDPIRVKDLKIEGSLALILDKAIDPNLVQTLEQTPALIHGGPFANIAHGCNSLIATSLALKLSDYVVTEAGFGSDLGAEKFLDLKCRLADLEPDAAVIVATVRALKLHGGVAFDDLAEENVEAVERGLPNLIRHIKTMQEFGVPAVVALNRFDQDTDAELDAVRKACAEHGVKVELSEVFAKGSEGGLDLAQAVLDLIDQGESHFKPMYELDTSLQEKLDIIVQKVYGGRRAILSETAQEQLKQLEALGYGQLPICVAKTPNSLTEDSKILGAPTDFDIHIRELRLSAGAGFIVCLAGNIMTMPGLPRRPMAEKIDVVDGKAIGLM